MSQIGVVRWMYITQVAVVGRMRYLGVVEWMRYVGVVGWMRYVGVVGWMRKERLSGGGVEWYVFEWMR